MCLCVIDSSLLLFSLFIISIMMMMMMMQVHLIWLPNYTDILLNLKFYNFNKNYIVMPFLKMSIEHK